ncbi:MAG: hypothetical protein OEZ03_16250, partial [Alphaproteobacteria bacterium]|nr:hypothetical protein [Alphaproteobacteria bacterium]
MAVAVLSATPGAAGTADSGSMVNYGWKIVWDTARARMTHVETGKEVELYHDERGTSEEAGYTNFEMLSVVGPVISYAVDWYSEGGAHPSYGQVYSTIDISQLNPAGDKDGNVPLIEANL